MYYAKQKHISYFMIQIHKQSQYLLQIQLLTNVTKIFPMAKKKEKKVCQYFNFQLAWYNWTSYGKLCARQYVVASQSTGQAVISQMTGLLMANFSFVLHSGVETNFKKFSNSILFANTQTLPTSFLLNGLFLTNHSKIFMKQHRTSKRFESDSLIQ